MRLMSVLSVLFSIFLLVLLTFSHRATTSLQFLFHCTEYESYSSDNQGYTLSYVLCGREKWRQRVWANTQSRVTLSDPTGPAAAQADIRQFLFFKARVYSQTVHVRFMVDKVVLRQNSSQALRSSLQVIIAHELYVHSCVMLGKQWTYLRLQFEGLECHCQMENRQRCRAKKCTNESLNYV
jgi:hypothetical protein